ncbi:hypothetical protein DsansV1_C44g0240961 [Dioscorea sansibarensis]
MPESSAGHVNWPAQVSSPVLVPLVQVRSPIGPAHSGVSRGASLQNASLTLTYVYPAEVPEVHEFTGEGAVSSPGHILRCGSHQSRKGRRKGKYEILKY